MSFNNTDKLYIEYDALVALITAINSKITSADASALVNTAIADLVGSAPAALDTIHELAAALQNDETAIAGLLTALDGKVDQTEYDAAIGALQVYLNNVAADTEQNSTDIANLQVAVNLLSGMDLSGALATVNTRLDALEVDSADYETRITVLEEAKVFTLADLNALLI